MKKHDKICDDLERRLNNKNYVSQTHKCIEYSKGECDILTLQNNRFVYYEVKSNDSPRAIYKATRQLQRWSKYWHKHYNKDCYGVYYTPTKMMILTKNGVIR